MQNVFGSGVVWGTPLTDAYGASIANPTPVPFGVMQDVSVDIGFDVKQLYGQNQFPVAVARGKGKIDCKAKYGQINGQMLNSLFFGQSLSTGLIADYRDLIGSAVPAGGGPFSPTIPSGGMWTADLGVLNSNGIPLICVATAPAAGQYSVSNGAYTFAAADAASIVFVSFQYTAASTTAKKLPIMNLAMGSAPTFRCDLFNSYQTKGLGLSFYSCMSSKLSLSSKQDDFMIPEMDFSAFADPLGRVGIGSFAE